MVFPAHPAPGATRDRGVGVPRGRGTRTRRARGACDPERDRDPRDCRRAGGPTARAFRRPTLAREGDPRVSGGDEGPAAGDRWCGPGEGSRGGRVRSTRRGRAVLRTRSRRLCAVAARGLRVRCSRGDGLRTTGGRDGGRRARRRDRGRRHWRPDDAKRDSAPISNGCWRMRTSERASAPQHGSTRRGTSRRRRLRRLSSSPTASSASRTLR